MATSGSSHSVSTNHQASSSLVNLGSATGVCIMSNAWKNEQDPSLISFISAFLSTNSFRLNFVSISPDLIFNCGGVSVAFVFVTKWDCRNVASIFSRVKRLKGQFSRLYVVATLTTKEQNDSFMRSYFQYEMEFGKPAFVQVTDAEMGFQKIVKIAHSRGVCKQQKVASKLKVERKQSVQGTDIFIRIVTSIPKINKHDANTLYQAIGSIEAIAKASKEDILANTDLSSEKAEILTKFFQDPEFYLPQSQIQLMNAKTVVIPQVLAAYEFHNVLDLSIILFLTVTASKGTTHILFVVLLLWLQ